MMIRIEQLQQILELDKTHSMHKASANLFISQPAISTALVKLEEELGIKIFVRTNKGVYPTPDGQPVIDIAKGVFKELNKLYLLTNDSEDSAFTQMNIYCNSSLSTSILATVLPKFHSYFPKLAFNFIEGDFDQLLKGVANDPHGLGLVYQPTGQNFPTDYQDTLDSQKICNAYPYLAISHHCDYKPQCTLTLEEVATLPLVSYANGSVITDYIFDYLNQYCTPNIILTAPNGVVYTKYIESGMACGFTVLLENNLVASRINPDLVHLAVLEMDVSFELIQIQNKQFPSVLSQQFLRLLHEQATLAKR